MRGKLTFPSHHTFFVFQSINTLDCSGSSEHSVGIVHTYIRVRISHCSMFYVYEIAYGSSFRGGANTIHGGNPFHIIGRNNTFLSGCCPDQGPQINRCIQRLVWYLMIQAPAEDTVFVVCPPSPTEKTVTGCGP